MSFTFWEVLAMVGMSAAFAVQIRAERRRWRHWLFFWCIWMIAIIVLSRALRYLLRI
jgi:hypothetical protein